MGKRRAAKLWILFLVGMGLMAGIPGCGNEESTDIVIAAKPETEQYILSEMLKNVIEDSTNLQVKIVKGVEGGTSNIQPALLRGEYDMYPESAGAGWFTVLKEKTIPSQEQMWEKLQKKYKKKYHLEWVGQYGYQSSYALMMRKGLAEEYHIDTIRELAPYSHRMILGGDSEFLERKDGLTGLMSTYRLEFQEIEERIGPQRYQLLRDKSIDITNVLSTEAVLGDASMRMLEDDAGFFRSYDCGTVVRQSVLREYPELREVLMKLDGIMTDQDMARLNYTVEINHTDEADAARDFLMEKGIIEGEMKEGQEQ